RGQNKHGLKKIKHALLSSQETITLPVQAPEPVSRSALPWKALFAFAPFPMFPAVLCLYFIRYSVSRNSAVFGVPDRGKARLLPLFSAFVVEASGKRLFHPTCPRQCPNRFG
ncbi:hypothetical protein ACFV4I_22900, partial [Nocardiopsis alba]|uniref:hypothetical protein n=1 Tax=Nocardiopsis alba TaxID=53437 RepID=UPI003660DD62